MGENDLINLVTTFGAVAYLTLAFYQLIKARQARYAYRGLYICVGAFHALALLMMLAHTGLFMAVPATVANILDVVMVVKYYFLQKRLAEQVTEPPFVWTPNVPDGAYTDGPQPTYEQEMDQ